MTMTTVTDVLIGNTKVRVLTEDTDYEYELSDNTITEERGIPDDIRKALHKNGIETPGYPIEFKQHVYDEASPHQRREIAEELGLDTDKDEDLIYRIANVGHHLELSLTLTEDKTCHITHVNGHKLEEKCEV